MRPVLKLALLALPLSLCCAAGSPAATLEPVGSFEQPIFVSSDPGDPNRLLVAEREGRVMEVQGGVVSELADLTPLVSCCTSERGLLSIAPAPDLHESGLFYAAYTGKPGAGGAEGDIHVDAFHHDGGTLVRQPILSIGHAANANHNGGQLQFGPDGYLYISTGDGGGGGDPLGSGQSLSTLLGKILRIDPRPGETPAYVIPPGNPFAGGGSAEIWSYGLRNPWRFSFDLDSGDMVIADVGQGAREEVDLAPSPAPGAAGGSGANYGWNCREGFAAYLGAPESCDGVSGFTDPVFDYPHIDPEDGGAYGCAITGGYVVRDASLDDLFGRYLYADFCVGELRSLALPMSAGGLAGDDRSEGLEVANPVSFGEDSCGRLYVAVQDGAVYRLVGAAPAACPSPSSPHAPEAASGASGQSRGKSRQGKIHSLKLRLLRNSRRSGRGLRLRLTVIASPCAGRAGSVAQLNRGGRRFARKPLDRGCRARFHLRVNHRSTFRALLPDGDYRSQVLTIALAKPRP